MLDNSVVLINCNPTAISTEIKMEMLGAEQLPPLCHGGHTSEEAEDRHETGLMSIGTCHIGMCH